MGAVGGTDESDPFEKNVEDATTNRGAPPDGVFRQIHADQTRNAIPYDIPRSFDHLRLTAPAPYRPDEPPHRINEHLAPYPARRRALRAHDRREDDRPTSRSGFRGGGKHRQIFRHGITNGMCARGRVSACTTISCVFDRVLSGLRCD